MVYCNGFVLRYIVSLSGHASKCAHYYYAIMETDWLNYGLAGPIEGISPLRMIDFTHDYDQRDFPIVNFPYLSRKQIYLFIVDTVFSGLFEI